jgi:outer membrane receptor protein involved in Fe transport
MKKTTLLLMMVILMASAMAQTTIRGQVKDAETGNPLPGATIQCITQQCAAITDQNGLFQIHLPIHENQGVRISYIGYATVSLPAQTSEDLVVVGLMPATEQLGTVVVTATRNKRGEFEVPIRLGIIRQSDLQQMPLLSADDALRSIAGVNISRGASYFGSATVSMRGTGSEAGRTLIMLDGVPVNKSDGGSVNWNAIPFGNIEQIEAITGPGSSIYGGNAMGGVINLISKTPHKRLQADVFQQYGSFNTYHTNAQLSGRENKFFWGINGMYRSSDGYITAPADEIDEYTIPAFLDEYQLGGRIGYNLNPDHTIDLHAGYYDGKRGTGTKFTGYGFENDKLASGEGAYNQYTNKNIRLVYRGVLTESTQLNLTLYGQQETYANIRESLRNDRISRYDVTSFRDDMGLNSSFHFKLGRFHKATAGIDLRYGAVDGNDKYITSTDEVINRGKMNQLGLFLQDEIRLGESPLSLLAGIRFDFASFDAGEFIVNNPTNETAFLQDFDGSLDNAGFSAFSPRISLQYFEKGQYRVYIGYSKGFRAPVLDDLCRTGRISGGMKLANPSLKPEYLDNYEIGADFFIGRFMRISPTAYFAKGMDYHAYISTGDSLVLNNRLRPIRIKDNIGEVAIWGAELEMGCEYYGKSTSAGGLYHTKTEIKAYGLANPDKEDNLVGKALVYQPTDGLHTSLGWQSDIVNGFISFNYKGMQWLDDMNSERIQPFLYADLRLGKAVYKGLHASINIHNLFGHGYIDSRNLVAPGRMIMAELRLTL